MLPSEGLALRLGKAVNRDTLIMAVFFNVLSYAGEAPGISGGVELEDVVFKITWRRKRKRYLKILLKDINCFLLPNLSETPYDYIILPKCNKLKLIKQLEKGEEMKILSFESCFFSDYIRTGLDENGNMQPGLRRIYQQALHQQHIKINKKG